MGWNLLTESFKSIVIYCTHFWTTRGIVNISSKHFFYSMLDDSKKENKDVINILKYFNIDAGAVRNKLFPVIPEPICEASKPFYTKDMYKIINDNLLDVKERYGSLTPNSITSVDIFMTMLISEYCVVNQIFAEKGISPDIVIEYIESDKFVPEESTDSDNSDSDLENDNISYNSIVDEINDSNLSNISDDSKAATLTVDEKYPCNDDKGMKEQPAEYGESKPAKKRTRAIDRFCTNLIELAAKGKIERVIGREKEIKSLMEVLSRKIKPNALLIGEAGVGKSAVVEGLAHAIANGDAPYHLSSKRIMSLDVNSVVAGTELRGEFERKIKVIVDELKASADTILFIDEFHNIMGSGNSSGKGDMGNVLKPALARGEIQVIGATTQDEYSRYILQDSALERRFQVIHVSEPTDDMAVSILNGLKDSFEKFHNIDIQPSAIEAAVRYSKKYIANRFLPDKCIDILDMAGAKSKLRSIKVPEEITALRDKLQEIRRDKDNAARDRNTKLSAELYKEELSASEKLKEMENEFHGSLKNDPVVITEKEIGEVISDLTEIPAAKIRKDESERLLGLENMIAEKLIGQREAISIVSRAIRRSRVGISDWRKPTASFLFTGPSGVGKTELARQLANELFGKDENLLKFDMSEYSEQHDVSKLLGSAPGFTGHEEGGKLTDAVRHYPYSIILFDEIEKAHKNICNIMLQILEDGKITDARGRDVYFNNTVIIFTSNVGTKKAYAKDALGFGNMSRSSTAKEIISKECEAHFSPEFLNRLDEVIIFDRLSHDEISGIVDLQIAKLNDRLRHRNIVIRADVSMKEQIIKVGYNEKHGARPIGRAINELIGDYISDRMLKGEIDDNMSLSFSCVGGNIKCMVSAAEERGSSHEK